MCTLGTIVTPIECGFITPEKFSQLGHFIEELYSTEYPYLIDHLQTSGVYADEIMTHFPELSEADKQIIHYAAVGHDIMKGKHFVEGAPNLIIDGHEIVQSIETYVKDNIDMLKPFHLESYIYSDVQLHALAAGIFTMKEFGIDDERLIYAIFFHSCPVLDIYESLHPKLQRIIDIVVLADKLSANKLKPKYGKKIPFDLELAVFGESHLEFNFTLGLYLARLIGNGKSKDPVSRRMIDYYYQRAIQQNPLIKLLDSLGTTVSLKVLKKLTKKVKDGADVPDTDDDDEEVEVNGQEASADSADGDGSVAGNNAASVTD